jgi:hypothetical protein
MASPAPISSAGESPADPSVSASARVTASITPSPTSRTRKGPARSATAPPTSSNSTRGRLIAVSTRPASTPLRLAAAQVIPNASTCVPSRDKPAPASQNQNRAGRLAEPGASASTALSTRGT